ncbi:MAG: class I SAM-dependent methyltransferase family protein [Candidatus Aenigmatarchaeota archaeon]
MASYEIIGSRDKAVAVVELREENESEVVEQIIKRHKNVKSVLKKVSERKGVERLREYEILWGEENTEVIHKEYGYKLVLDPQKVYFSPREGTERQRIASMVKDGETVMVMFAGVGPIAVAIAKKKPKTHVIAIEINPHAVEYMKKNVKINKLEGKIDVVLGDVRDKCQKYFGCCDRVIMPLPHKSELFLDLALKCLKNGGWIHLYVIKSENEIENFAKKIAEDINAKDYKIKKVLPYAPRIYKYCIDIML